MAASAIDHISIHAVRTLMDTLIVVVDVKAWDTARTAVAGTGLTTARTDITRITVVGDGPAIRTDAHTLMVSRQIAHWGTCRTESIG